MTNVSRRQFLQFMGLTGLSTQLRWLETPTALQGRALGRVAVLERPQLNATRLTTLWPDSVHRVSIHNADWLRVGQGYAPVTAFQPMLTPDPATTLTSFPAWAEVVAPVVVVRAYCAGDAPLRERLEHGQVVEVQRALQDDKGAQWLQVSNGWLQAEHVQAAPMSSEQGPATQLRIGQGMMEVFAHQKRILRAACRTPRQLPAGGRLVQKQPATQHGEPWYLDFGSVHLHGVCHHNQFGTNATPCDDNCIELPLLVARTLYLLIQNGAELVR
ncbi:MAG: hypothetical protein H6673_11280 [Anaerolineales bacterium]|nr:hypothetical protein [Anaerolineales bacterium]